MSVMGKTFPAFPAHAHAHPAILRNWQEAHCGEMGLEHYFVQAALQLRGLEDLLGGLAFAARALDTILCRCCRKTVYCTSR